MGELAQFFQDMVNAVRGWGLDLVPAEVALLALWQLPGVVLVGISMWRLRGRRSRR